MSEKNGQQPGREGLSGPEAEALLEKSHDFPCDYMIKVIGYGDRDMEKAVSEAVGRALGRPEPICRISCRPSRNGRYLAVTLEARVTDAKEVLAVYEELKGLDGLVALV